ncbi:MAG: histidine phosphatase family protein [Roseiarcus sp.]
MEIFAAKSLTLVSSEIFLSFDVSPPNRPPLVTATQFILVRHGETAWNREGRIQGHLDSPLNADGIAQARTLAERLRMESFAALISSDLGRARRTAQYISMRTGHTVIVDTRLRERQYGIFEGLTRSEAKSVYPDVYARYEDESVTYAIPGGESAEECFLRNLECLQELADRYPDRRIVVVTHGGVLDGLYRHVMGLPHVGSRAFAIVNASLNRFTYENDVWRLDRWGDVGHLGQSESLDDI